MMLLHSLQVMVQVDRVLQTDGSGTLSFSTVGGTGLTIFTYSITSNTTSITGNDDSNNSLSYEAGK